MNAPPVTILIVAAGASSRMRGADKLLEPVNGAPLLARLAGAALATGCSVIVALPPGAAARHGALDGLAVRRVTVPRADLGMGESLREGVTRVPPGHGALVMLGDMPEIETADLDRLLSVFAGVGGATVVRAAGEDGTPGHPVIFPARVLPAFAGLRGDRGARDILHDVPVHLVPLPGDRALIDLDTPEAWAAWRARRPPPS